MQTNSIFLATRVKAAATPRGVQLLLTGILFVTLTAYPIVNASAQTLRTAAPTQDAKAAQVISFKDFFKLPVGPRGLDVSPALQQAHGKTVQLTGYMVLQENATPGQFMLTPRPVQMTEHADGEADDLPPATVLVRLDPAQATWAVPHVRGLIQLQGKLSIQRVEGSDGRMSWVQLQLAPTATKTMSAPEFASYLHAQQHSH